MSILERKGIRQRIYKKYENFHRGEFHFFNKSFDYYTNKTYDLDVCDKNWTYDFINDEPIN